MGRIVFITGVSGVGKSSVLRQLAGKGYSVVDTDYCGWTGLGRDGHVWDEERIAGLLAAPRVTALVLSGTVSNQGKFYDRFDEIVVLTAPESVVMQRVSQRQNNPYGKTERERQDILDSIKHVQPLLLERATKVIDATLPLDEVVAQIEPLLGGAGFGV